MIIRLIVLATLLIVAFGVVAIAERWRSRSASGLPAGLTLVTTTSCRDCVHATAVLDSLDAEYTMMDASEASDLGVHTLTVPYAAVTDTNGDVIMVRRGRSVAADASALARASSDVGVLKSA